MKITTSVTFTLDQTNRYVKVSEESFDYDGPIALLCGASAAQKANTSATASGFTAAQNQAQSIFANDQANYQDLMNTFAPTVQAGPSQYGFDNQEDANLRSQAITTVGQQYKNEKQALGETEAAYGGGTSVLPGGASVGLNLGLAENAGNKTASELGDITNAGYAQGAKNYSQAVEGELAAPGVFQTGTSATNAASTAGGVADTSANNTAQSAASPWQLAAGIAGAGVGAATGGITKKLLG